MSLTRAPQFSFNDKSEPERITIEHINYLKGSNKKTEVMTRLITAAVYLDKVNPHLVDILSRSLSDSVTIEQFEVFCNISKELLSVSSKGHPTDKQKEHLVVEKNLSEKEIKEEALTSSKPQTIEKTEKKDKPKPNEFADYLT